MKKVDYHIFDPIKKAESYFDTASFLINKFKLTPNYSIDYWISF